MVLYIHTNIVTKKCWEQNARKNFSRNTLIVHAKNVGKKTLRKEVRKNVFYIHRNVVTKKWGKKRAKQFFQKHTNSASEKCLKKSSERSAKYGFLYSHENRDQKMLETKREKKIFPDTQE